MNDDLVGKIMKPVREMSREEKIEYICLANQIGAKDAKKGGLVREVYRITAQSIARDKDFIYSLSKEEIKKILENINTMEPETYTKSINLESEELEHE